VDPATLRILFRWMHMVWVVTLSMKSRSWVMMMSSFLQARRNWVSQRTEMMSR